MKSGIPCEIVSELSLGKRVPKLYALLDCNLKLLTLSHDTLKSYMTDGKLDVKNYRLDSANRLFNQYVPTDKLHTHHIAMQRLDGFLQKLKLIGYEVMQHESYNKQITLKAIKKTANGTDVIWIIPDDVVSVWDPSLSLSDIVGDKSLENLEKLGEPINLKVVGGKNLVNATNLFLYFNVQKLDISQLITDNIVTTNGMFSWCTVPEIDLSNFNASQLTDVSHMFWMTSADIKNIQLLDTSNVSLMYGMFYGMLVDESYTSSINTSSVKDMGAMFTDASASYLNLNNFDTSNVKNMCGMFENVHIGILDISNFDTRDVVSMETMFREAHIGKLILGDKFKIRKNTNTKYIFTNSKIGIIETSDKKIRQIYDEETK